VKDPVYLWIEAVMGNNLSKSVFPLPNTFTAYIEFICYRLSANPLRKQGKKTMETYAPIGSNEISGNSFPTTRFVSHQKSPG
jgi:hypothetical protein